MDILIRRSGTVIDVSPDGRSSLPAPIYWLLRSQLWYEHLHLNRGADRYDTATGRPESVSVESRELFVMDSYGKLCTGYGFTARIARTLTAAGHRVFYQDLSPPRRRPDCYQPDWSNLHRHYRCRPGQEECLRRIEQAPGGIINAPTAFGKTRLFGAIAHLYPRAKIAIVAKPADVVAKVVRRLTAEFPGVGQFGGGVRQRGQRITVFVAKSMHYAEEDFDFLLADEAHQLMAPNLSEALGQHFTLTRNYGFTATPQGRLDGADIKLEMFFGPEIFRMTYQQAVDLGLVVPIYVRWVPVILPSGVNPALGKRDVPRLRWGIWRNQERNAIIAHDYRTHYGNDVQVLMAVATIDHAFHLWQYLPEFTLCYSDVEEKRLDGYKRSGMIPASFQPMTPERRDELRQAFEQGTLKRAIATDIWSTGVDFEGLQVLYRCDARESSILATQWPGRVSRLHENKGCGEVVDFVDTWDESFRRKSRARKEHYKTHNWYQDWPRGRRQASAI